LRKTATSLFHVLGRKTDRVELLCRFLECLEEGYDLLNREGAAPILARWERWSRIRGERVRVVTLRERIEGVAEGVNSEGALMVRLPDGGRREIYAGDVEIVKSR
ncbi:MAG: hypothetical protein HY760_02000, partial [Nitrospirae bacterium]|nr:hypothetical protein [Nitrospirota bacterium]